MTMLAMLSRPWEFEWHAGVTPLSSASTVVATWVVYWLTILVLKKFTSRESYDPKTIPFLRPLTAIHNGIICLWSLIMFLGTVYSLRERVLESPDGWKALFCSTATHQTKGNLEYWLYIYYVSKFYELLDTVLLILNKRPLIFLHWYHHTIVVAMCWVWLEYDMAFGGLGMLANTFVHVAMYYYYMGATLKWNVWFKRYITQMQIIQFATSFVLGVIYKYLALTGPCIGGDTYAFEFSLACNLSFFFLFIHFYRTTYKKKKDAAANQEKKSE